MAFTSVEKAIQRIKEGGLVLVSDSEDRENEGDLICSLEGATPENINFMIKHARGLLCAPISSEIVDMLDLPLMVNNNTDNHETAFTVSIDYIDTTTGISAYERSLTALKMIDSNSKPEDFRRPGHLFPLLAKDKGVIERQGHTEATVDLAVLAGSQPAGLCIEIVAEDGQMMKQGDLHNFSDQYDLPYITIEQLKEYRLREKRVFRETSVSMPTGYGQFQAVTFVEKTTNAHHIALVKGDISDGEDVLCRVHSECLTGDVFGSNRCDCGEQFAHAMREIEETGRGILLYMRQEGRGIGLVNKMKAYQLQEKGYDTVEANHMLGFADDLRDYGVASQMLVDLGVNSIQLMTNNTDKIKQLENYGIHISNRLPIEMQANKFDEKYLKTKQEKMGHLLSF